MTREVVEEYLGKNLCEYDKIHAEPMVGVINGLYATERGQGGILPIQIYNNYTSEDGKFTLKLTGNQRKIMRESVMASFTAAIHCIRHDLRDAFISKHPAGLHIHCPGSAATVKDGPSGGIVFTSAFISRILNKKIRNDVAATGEIELTGKIAKIGGLQYKLPGAKRAGIKLALVSAENEDDIKELRKEYPTLFDENFDVILVKNIRDCLEHMLVNYDPTEII